METADPVIVASIFVPTRMGSIGHKKKMEKSLGQKKRFPTRPTNHLGFSEGTHAMIDLCKSPIEKRFVKKSKLHLEEG